MSKEDKSGLIREELAKLHSIKVMYEKVKTIAEKIGCSEQWIRSEIRKQMALREDVAQALFDLFVVRSDTYAMQREDKSYVRIGKPLTIELLKDHLEGKTTIGTYNLDRENRVKWLCFDIDIEAVEKPRETALLIYQACREAFSLKAVFLEASRYDDPSYHVWVVFQPEIPAYVAKFLGERILEKCNNPKIELFPKQTKLEKEGFGNLMKIPLGLHRQSKKWSCLLAPTFEPLPIESVFDVEGCSLLDREIAEIKRITEREKPSYWFEREAEEKEPYKGEFPPCVCAILKGVKKGIRNESAIRLACFWLNFCKKPPQEALTLLREWNAKNKPPLESRELEIRIKSALRGGYNYGCDDSILKQFCDKKACFPPFYAKPKKVVECSLVDALDAEKMGKQYVKVKVQVLGHSKPKAIEGRTHVTVQNNGNVAEVRLEEIKNFKALKSELFGSWRGKIKPLATFLRSLYSGAWGCKREEIKLRYEGNLNWCRLYIQDYVDVTQIDRVQSLDMQDAVLIGKRPEELLKNAIITAEAEGLATTDRRGNVILFIYKISPLETWKVISQEGFDEWFRNNLDLVKDIDMSLANEIYGREKAKLLACLVMHSPLAFNFEGRLMRGNLMVMFVGDTKLGKSRILRRIADLGIGQYASGDTCRRTGLLYRLEQKGTTWKIFWGLLPQNDRGLLLLDSYQHLLQKDIQEMREAYDQGLLQVYGASSGVAPMRTRLITSANPFETTMMDYRYGCLAVKDIKGLRDPRDITRFDLYMPFRSEDVEARVIAEAERKPIAIPIDVLRNHVWWVWGLKPDQIMFSDEAIKEIRQRFLEFQKMGGQPVAGLPLIHAGFKEVIARISVSFACLHHNVNEEGKVVVTKAHVEEACDMISWCLRRLDFFEYSDVKRAELEITAQQWAELEDLLAGHMYLALKEIGDHKGIKRGTLAERLMVEPRTATKYINKLEAYNLVEKATPSGWKTTVRGNKVLRAKEKAQVEAVGKQTLLPTIEEALLANPHITSDFGVTIDELIEWAESETGAKRETIYKVLERLEKAGTLFRPKPARIKKV